MRLRNGRRADPQQVIRRSRLDVGNVHDVTPLLPQFSGHDVLDIKKIEVRTTHGNRAIVAVTTVLASRFASSSILCMAPLRCMSLLISDWIRG